MAHFHYLIRYTFAMKKLHNYKEEKNQELTGLQDQSTEILKEEKHAAWNDRKTALLVQIHGIQLNIAWVVQKIEELEKLQGYNFFRPNQLEAVLKDDDVKERLGNV